MMTRNPIPTDEAIQVALAGVFRSGVTTFFEITEAGEHRKLHVSDRLRQLLMSYGSISTLLKAYPFPELKYRRPYLIAKEEAAAKARPRVRRAEPDEELTEDDLEDEVSNSKRYSLTKCGDYYGAWDEQEASQVLFKTQAEAIEHIHQLLHGGDMFRIQYGHCRRTSRKLGEVQEVHW
jgi:hypothetical protein